MSYDTAEPGIMDRLLASLHTLTESHEALTAHLRRPPPQPVYRPVQMAGPFSSASGFLCLNLGGPEQGRIWHVRSISVGVQTPTGAANGRADVFSAATTPCVGPPITGDSPGRPGFYSPTGFANGCILNWRDFVTTLPSAAFYSVGDLVVLSNQSLYVVISSGTNTSVYEASAVVEDQQDAAYQLVRV